MFLKRIVLVLGCVLLFAACGDDAAAPETTDEGGDSGSTIEVSAADFSFSPASFEVEPGAEVEVVLTNNGQSSHTFTIDGVVDFSADPGDEETETFTAPDESAEFYCTIHPDMTGELVVAGSASGDSGSSSSDQDLDY